MQGCRTTRAEAIQHSPKGPEISPEATKERSHESHNLPTFCPLFSKILLLSPFSGIAKHRQNTKAPQKILSFCPFSAYFEPFCPCLRVLGQLQPPRCSQGAGVLPMLFANQTHKDRGTRDKGQGTRTREAHNPTRQADKDGSPTQQEQQGTRE